MNFIFNNKTEDKSSQTEDLSLQTEDKSLQTEDKSSQTEDKSFKSFNYFNNSIINNKYVISCGIVLIIFNIFKK